jgi:peptidoglycan/LPS O-acetylase OafA/YrhL
MVTLKNLSNLPNNNITALRLIASFAVIWGHSHAITLSGTHDIIARITGYAHAGGIAVDFFFLLSGFLVTSSVIKRDILSYSISRCVRVFPALWIYLLIMVFIIAPFLSNLSLINYIKNESTFKYLINIGCGISAEWFLPGVFETNRNKAINGSIWSIIIEIRLYLYLAIFKILGGFKSRTIYNLTVSTIIILVWANLISIPGINGKTDSHVALFFVIGSVLYVNRELINISPIYALVAAAIAAITHGTPNFQYGYILIIVSVFLYLAFNDILSNFLTNDYSYGVYLWGWPIQQVVAEAWPKASPIMNTFISIILALGVSIASWHFIEKKLLLKKDKLITIVKTLSKQLLIK